MFVLLRLLHLSNSLTLLALLALFASPRPVAGERKTCFSCCKWHRHRHRHFTLSILYLALAAAATATTTATAAVAAAPKSKSYSMDAVIHNDKKCCHRKPSSNCGITKAHTNCNPQCNLALAIINKTTKTTTLAKTKSTTRRAEACAICKY